MRMLNQSSYHHGQPKAIENIAQPWRGLIAEWASFYNHSQLRVSSQGQTSLCLQSWNKLRHRRICEAPIHLSLVIVWPAVPEQGSENCSRDEHRKHVQALLKLPSRLDWAILTCKCPTHPYVVSLCAVLIRDGLGEQQKKVTTTERGVWDAIDVSFQS